MVSECQFAFSKVATSEPYPGFLFPRSLALSANLALTKLRQYCIGNSAFHLCGQTDLGETFTFYFNNDKSKKDCIATLLKGFLFLRILSLSNNLALTKLRQSCVENFFWKKVILVELSISNRIFVIN